MIDNDKIAELRRLEAGATVPSVKQIEAADKATGGKIPLILLIQALVAAMEARDADYLAMRNALPELLDRLDDLVVENEMLRKVNSSLGHMLPPHGGVDVG